MPKNIKQRTQKSRTQGYDDLINVYGYVPGEVRKDDGTMHEEVELSQELLIVP